MEKQTFKCEKCGGEFKKKSKATGTGAGCLIVIIGVLLIGFFPVGTIIGIILILVGLGYGSKQQHFWVCKNCGFKFEREKKLWEF